MEFYWEWSTIASTVDTLNLSTFPHSSYLVVFSGFCYFRLESPKGWINSVPNHYIFTVCLRMTIDKDRCIAKAKTVLHWFFKHVYFIRLWYKVRSTIIFCYISSCVLNPLLYTTNQCFPCMFLITPMIKIKTKMINFLCNCPASVVPSIGV